MKYYILVMLSIIISVVISGKSLAFDSLRRSIDVAVAVDSSPGVASYSDSGCVRNNSKNDSCIMIASVSKISVTDSYFSVPIYVYRGSTLKRTIYVWLADASGTAVSSKVKLSVPARFSYYNLSAEFVFSHCIESGEYFLTAEGLGVNESKSVFVDFVSCNDSIGSVSKKAGAVSYNIISSLETVDSHESFKTLLQVSNPTPDDLELYSWSYVYRSSKCYSGARDGNKKVINLSSFSNVTFELENIVFADSGNYSLKVVFLISGRKTPYELVVPIGVIGNSSGVVHSIADSLDKLIVSKDNNRTSKVSMNSISNNSGKRKIVSSVSINASDSSSVPVYESASFRAGKLVVYFIIFILALLLLLLLFKKL